MSRSIWLIVGTGLIVFSLLLGGCGPASPTNSPAPEQEQAEPVTETPQPTPTFAQPTPTFDHFGPDKNNFPPGFNPLSGQAVKDPPLLQIPALLVSISHFPATARPQAGLSFAPYVFEYYITEGATRFLTVFYGEFPEPEIPVTGECEIRKGVFTQTGILLGNQVWLDENANGVHEVYEPGVGGICVNLYNGAGEFVAQTTTDSNGYYGFNVVPAAYSIEFVIPSWMQFTGKDAGDDYADSDADQLSGRIEAINVTSDASFWDAGLIPSANITATPNPSAYMPLPRVGPVRSGRLIYAYIQDFFQESCLIYAFASEEVLERIPQCAFVTHEVQGGGYMLELERMRAIAEDNARKTRSDFNYASNVYDSEPPEGGAPASEVNVYIAYLNQSGWKYDPLYQSWLRYVDTSEYDQAGILHPEVDRLTGRQLHFENLIVIFAEHTVVMPTNLDIHLEQGNLEPALLFRDGRMYRIKWSTKSGEYEKTTGLRRPIQFINPDGTPIALKPGHTWVLVVTPFTSVKETSPGVWQVLFAPPEGAK